MTAQAEDRQGSPWAGRRSPVRDTPCLHKPELGKVRLILNLNKQGEKAMPEFALPGGDAQQWGTAHTAWLCPAQVPVGLSPGAHTALGETRQTQTQTLRPGGPPFLHKELSAESVLAVGRAAAACLCKIPPTFTGKYPLWDPCPIGNSTGACCPPATVHNTVLGNNQEEQKKYNKIVCGSRGKWKKKSLCFSCQKENENQNILF